MSATLTVSILIFCASLLEATESSGGCPFKKKDDTPKPDIRGHQQPFGYHAKQWKRIETLYEHPHPEVFYEKYMRASKPVIIRGGAKHWPAIHKWTNLTYLNHQTRFGRPDINWKKMYSYDSYHPVRVRMTMKEFTSGFNNHSLYMDATLPVEIADDVRWPKSLSCPFYQKRTKQIAIMFNNGKSSSDLHMDSTCTYFIQVTGSRRWLLTPPKQVKNVYSGMPSLIDHNGISIVDQNSVDLEKHNRVQDLTIYGAIMDPGDIIYVPEGWHHQVKTYDSPNIGIVWFMNYLLCEFHTNPDLEDDWHVHKCVNQIREQRPRQLKCKLFKEDNLSVPDVVKKYPPPNPGTMMQELKKPSLHFGVTDRMMNDGNTIIPMGISFVGQSHNSKETRKALRLAVVEGYRMFCVSSADNSSLVIGKTLGRHKKISNSLKFIAYLPKVNHGRENARKAVDTLRENLNVQSINILLLQADYCPSTNGSLPCERDALSEEIIATWRELEDAHRAGKIDTLGVSDFSLKELKQLLALSKVPVSVARTRFDPYFRSKEYRSFCRDNKIVFMGRSTLGGRWKTEAPDYPENRDITKEYYILRASFQYKTSVHGVIYDWALRKGVIICPRMDKEMHVRVAAQAFRSESKANPDNLNMIDDNLDPTDTALFSPKFKNYLPKESDTDDDEDDDKVVGVGEEKMIHTDDVVNSFDEQYQEMKKSEGDYSNQVYTDTDDFEKFPDFMKIPDPFKKL